MTAEELAASRRYVGPVVRLAIACRIPPVAMARISVGFAVIAAVWLSLGSARADGVALVAAVAVFVAVYVGRVLGRDVARVRRRLGADRLRPARPSSSSTPGSPPGSA